MKALKGRVKVARRVPINSGEKRIEVRPALTPEARENQMIAEAMDLVEQRLLNGTASSQETTHFLKLGSMKAQAELEKIRKETELIKAKADAVRSSESSEKLYSDAIKAFQKYSGSFISEEEEDGVY